MKEEQGEGKEDGAKEDANRVLLCLLITRRRHICIHVRASLRLAALTFSLNVIVCNNLMPPVSLLRRPTLRPTSSSIESRRTLLPSRLLRRLPRSSSSIQCCHSYALDRVFVFVYTYKRQRTTRVGLPVVYYSSREYVDTTIVRALTHLHTRVPNQRFLIPLGPEGGRACSRSLDLVAKGFCFDDDVRGMYTHVPRTCNNSDFTRTSLDTTITDEPINWWSPRRIGSYNRTELRSNRHVISELCVLEIYSLTRPSGNFLALSLLGRAFLPKPCSNDAT